MTARLACGGWLVLALAGQAASLLLIDAGKAVGYQHYRPPAGVAEGDVRLLAVLLVQALAVAAGLFRHAAPIAAFVRERVGAGRATLILLALVATSAFPSLDPSVFAIELGLASGIALAQLGCVVLAARAAPPEWLDALAVRGRALLGAHREGGTPGRGRPLDRDASVSAPRFDGFAVAAALFVTVVSAALALFSYERHPHVPDEVAYLFQARTLAHGALAAPAPPVPEAYDVYLIDCDAAGCTSPFPPGWPAVLAAGVRLGAGWLVNPVLGGLCVLLAYGLVGALYDRRTARVSVLLVCCSPWHVFMAMSFMSHTFALAAALLGALAVVQLLRTGKARFALAAGVAAGAVGLTRPLEGLAVALLLGPASLFARGRRVRLAPAAVLAAATLATAALVLPYNEALTGDPTRLPLMEYTDRVFGPGSNALGFGPDRDWGWRGLDPLPGHGPADVVINASLNATAIGIELFGWSTGSLLPLLFFVLCGRFRRSDAWLALAVAIVVGLQSLYWFSGGPDFGARYWYLILVPCVAWSARGLSELARRAAEAGRAEPPGGRGAARVAFGAAALCALALVTFFPWRAIDKYHHYRGMRPDVREWLASGDRGEALVFVRGEPHPDYASAFAYNPLDPRAPEPVFVRDLPELRSRVIAAYPERPVLVLHGPTVTGDGYRFESGPAAAAGAAAPGARSRPGRFAPGRP